MVRTDPHAPHAPSRSQKAASVNRDDNRQGGLRGGGSGVGCGRGWAGVPSLAVRHVDVHVVIVDEENPEQDA